MAVGEGFFVRARGCSGPGCPALVAFIVDRAYDGERAWAVCSDCGHHNELIERRPTITPLRRAAQVV
jgi:predicted RNA-binding Zn ribbon-like protein